MKNRFHYKTANHKRPRCLFYLLTKPNSLCADRGHNFIIDYLPTAVSSTAGIRRNVRGRMDIWGGH